MRGYIYSVARRLEDLALIDESDFYEDKPDCDWVETRGEEPVRNMLDTLVVYGATVVKVPVPECDVLFEVADTCYEVQVPVGFRMRYFANSFAELQKRVANMSLEQFACDPNSEIVSLCTLIDDHYGDLVYFGTETHGHIVARWHEFVRNMIVEGESFYVVADACVAMH